MGDGKKNMVAAIKYIKYKFHKILAIRKMNKKLKDPTHEWGCLTEADELKTALSYYAERATGNMNDCLICGKPVDYKPEYCCSGIECACKGLPINLCTCSVKCEAAVFDYIGFSFDERRKKSGIEKYNNAIQHISRYGDRRDP